MNVTIISTSPRKESNSLKVAHFMKGLMEKQDGVNVSLLDFEDADIPMVGRGSLSLESMTPFQKELIGKWDSADLVLFVVPEYNWITGGELINAFHQLGNKRFAHLFDNRAFAFAGVSSGKGGRLPGIEMTTLVNKIISVLNGHSIVLPKIFESQYTQEALNSKGESKGDASYERAAGDFVSFIVKMGRRWKTD
jgi:chromate reductase